MRMMILFCVFFWPLGSQARALASFELHQNEIDQFLSQDFLEYKDSLIRHSRTRAKDFQLGTQYVWQYPALTVPHEKIGFVHRPDSKIRHILRTDTEIIFDAIYTTDKYSRRVTPVSNPKERELFAMFFGCSYVHGYGLQDDETLPYYLGEKSTNILPLNYGISGSGPHMLLSQLENLEFQKQFSPKKGFLIYVYIDFHIQRANLFSHETKWLKKSPSYEKNEDGKMTYQGSFVDVSPWRTSFLNFVDEDLNWTAWSGRNFPWVTENHLRYTCDIITAAKNKFESDFPESEFIVWVHPTEGPMDPFVEKCLKQNQVEVVDVGHKFNFDESHRISHDGHPTAKANKIFADLLLQTLENYEKPDSQ